MSYTIQQIDDALRAISGERSVRLSDSGWSRPITMLHAAAAAWTDERPEDDHARVLREALRDLNATGRLHPSDGVWPE